MIPAERQAAIERRTAFVDRLRGSMPAAMRDLPQWLVWRFEVDPKRPKPLKVPYYTNGRKRVGTQGDEADRHRLVTFDAALSRLQTAMQFDGLGFAFLPGDGLVGIDIDGAIDLETGEISSMCNTLIEECASYTEKSPSGKGVHIITRGSTKIFKSNDIGLEVFCGAQYFTCSGDRMATPSADVVPLADTTLAYMRELVDEAKARAGQAKLAAAPPAPSSPPSASARSAAPSGGDDFKRVNDAALQALDAWVPEILPKARRSASTGGYRVASKDLGRQLEEDLSITPEGIMDFGEEQGYTAIDLVMRWSSSTTPKDALHWLAGRIGVQLSTRPLRLVSAPLPAAGSLSMDDRPEPPSPDEDGAASVVPIRGRRRKKSDTPPEGVGGGLKRLEQGFRLIYGTDAVWDGEQRITMAVKNLRLVFGNDAVKMWLASGDRRVVMQHDMVFEPGIEVAEHQVNLFDGLPMEPVPCDESEVKVMLDLLRHLCSMTATGKTSADEVMDWVLKWLAFPLQNVGAKMRSALVFHGPQGTGKNLFFDCIRSMYGKYGRMVGQTELDDKFNDWLSAKLLIIGNEVVTRQELFHNKNKLKWIVTEDEIPIRGMHQTVRWESNHAQVVFLSNENQPIAVEKDDRRHLVVYTPVAGDEDLYLRVADFLKDGGAGKFMHYLQCYDTSGFGEHTKPIMTEAKAALIELSLKPAERFVNEWLQGLLALPIHVCSAEQLYRVFRRWCDMTGEKWPMSQAQFTQTATRHVLERVQRHPESGERLPPKLAYKVVMLKHEIGPRKAMRCWIPRGTAPPDGVSEGEWAAAAVESFELTASRYGRLSAHEDEEPPR